MVLSSLQRQLAVNINITVHLKMESKCILFHEQYCRQENGKEKRQ